MCARTIGAGHGASSILCAENRSETSIHSNLLRGGERIYCEDSVASVSSRHWRQAVNFVPLFAQLFHHHKRQRVVLRCSKIDKDGNNSPRIHRESPNDSPDEQPLASNFVAPEPDAETSLPTFQDGVTWFCISLIALIGLIDIFVSPSSGSSSSP